MEKEHKVILSSAPKASPEKQSMRDAMVHLLAK